MITNKYNRSIISILIYLIVFAIAFTNEYLQFYFFKNNDLVSHIDRILPIINGTYFIPHPLFHYTIYGLYSIMKHIIPSISIGIVAVIFSSICVTTIYHFTFLILKYFLKEYYSIFSLQLFSFILIIVISIYIPCFNRNFYLGQWSPNIWHSPTMFLLKPFALISAVLMALLLQYKELTFKKQFILSTCLCLSALAKPSFVFSFLPAIALYQLIYNPLNFKLHKKLLFIVLPTLLVLVWQYFSTYFLDISSTLDLKDKIIFTYFGVTKLYTSNVFISLLLAIAFPTLVCLIDFKAFLKNKILILMWLNTFIAYLQSSFLAEEFKFDQAAFSFGYSISLTLLFIFSLIHFLQLIKIEQNNSQTKYCYYFVWLLLYIHLISGVCYYCANIFFNIY